jgi:hypothetical protein
MPWGPKSFAERHNHKLKGGAAKVAAEIATKGVEKGEPEDVAIREANAVGDRLQSRAAHRYRKR